MKQLIILALTLTASAAMATQADDSAKYEKRVRDLHLQLAVTSAEARVKGHFCVIDNVPSTILKELAAGTNGVKDLRAVVKAYPVFKKVLGKNLAFRMMLADINYQRVGKAEFEKVLVGTQFFSAGHGAYGSTVEFVVDAAGVLTIRRMDIDTFKWATSKGTYEIVETKDKYGYPVLSLRLNLGDGAQVYELSNSDDYTAKKLVPEGKESYEGYFSEASECDA